MPQTSWPLVGPRTRPGPVVSTVQHLLRAHGHDIAVDGGYDEQTRAAIVKFQAGEGLDVDGIVGDATWPALVVPVGRGSQGDAVIAAQSELARRTLAETADLVVDGRFGPRTEAAVRSFQRLLAFSGMPPSPIDGIVGRNTWFALVHDFAIADA